MTGRWFKFSETTLFDRRAQKLPAGLFRVFVNLLCARSWCGGRLPSIEDAAFLLRTSPAVLTRRLAALAAAGLVVEIDGVWELVDEQDEGEPLTPAERTRRWREKRQRDAARDDAVTAGDGLERGERTEETDSACESDESFQSFLAAFPERDEPHAAEPARAAWRKAVRDGAAPETLIAGASAYRTATAGRERRFVVSAARWLAEGRWRDAAPKPAAPLKEPGVWIADGSPEWRAWAVHWQETRGVSPPRDAKNGWRFPTLWPPSAVAAAV